MRNIWDRDRLYSFLRPYVDSCTRASYRRLKVEGTVPSDGAVLIAPNHTSTLMDALVVLQSMKGPSAYGARADIFRKEKVARILRFLKIVPIARMRDGAEEVSRNRVVFDEIDAIVEHKVPFCLFSEGRHRPMHSLLPIGKGIARIAFESASKRQTYLVPTGIDYDEFFHYRSCCRLRYGEPIDINAFLEEHKDCSEAEQYRIIREELFKRMSSLILYLPDDEHYEERLAEIMASRKRTPRALLWLSAIPAVPLFLLSSILALPMWATAETICRGLKDPAWSNTVRFGVRLAMTPIMLLIWALVFFLTLPWPIAAALYVCFLFSYSVFYDCLKLFRTLSF